MHNSSPEWWRTIIQKKVSTQLKTRAKSRWQRSILLKDSIFLLEPATKAVLSLQCTGTAESLELQVFNVVVECPARTCTAHHWCSNHGAFQRLWVSKWPWRLSEWTTWQVRGRRRKKKKKANMTFCRITYDQQKHQHCKQKKRTSSSGKKKHVLILYLQMSKWRRQTKRACAGSKANVLSVLPRDRNTRALSLRTNRPHTRDTYSDTQIHIKNTPTQWVTLLFFSLLEKLMKSNFKIESTVIGSVITRRVPTVMWAGRGGDSN